MKIPSLLSLCFEKVDYIQYDNIDFSKESFEKDIYQSVVDQSRNLIKKALTKYRTQLILRTIYLIKKEGNYTMIEEICRDLYNYDLGLFRIAMVHAVTSWIGRPSHGERIVDVIDVANMVLPENAKERELVLVKLLELKNTNNEDIDICQYIDIYMEMGHYLKP